MKDIELIEKYFNGLLNKEEKALFEEQMRIDSTLLSDVAHYIQLQQALKNNQLADRHSSWQNASKKKTYSLKNVFSMAAILTLFIGGAWYWTSSSVLNLEQQADVYIKEQFQERSIQMSASKDSTQKAIALFNEGDLKSSLEVSESMLKRQSENAEQLELAGITALRLNDYEKALSYFRKMETLDLYENPSVFYQAITLLKRKAPLDIQEAEKLLNRVADNQLGGKNYAQQWLNKK